MCKIIKYMLILSLVFPLSVMNAQNMDMIVDNTDFDMVRSLYEERR